MTHRDIYIKFMIGYDKANVTSSYPSLTEYEIATFLDKAYLALIAQKVTGNNSRHIGFEQDLKVTEDLGPLITTKRFTVDALNTDPISYVKNALSCEKPNEWLYFVSGELKRDTKTWDMQLIDHKVASKFYTTAYNIPWIKHPVCYIEGNSVYTLYDSISQKKGTPSLSLTYIKMPNKFMKEDGQDDSINTGHLPRPTISYPNSTISVPIDSYFGGMSFSIDSDDSIIISSSNDDIVEVTEFAGNLNMLHSLSEGNCTITYTSSKYNNWSYRLYVTVIDDSVIYEPETFTIEISGPNVINNSTNKATYTASIIGNKGTVVTPIFSITQTTDVVNYNLINDKCDVEVKPIADNSKITISVSGNGITAILRMDVYVTYNLPSQETPELQKIWRVEFVNYNEDNANTPVLTCKAVNNLDDEEKAVTYSLLSGQEYATIHPSTGQITIKHQDGNGNFIRSTHAITISAIYENAEYRISKNVKYHYTYNMNFTSEVIPINNWLSRNNIGTYTAICWDEFGQYVLPITYAVDNDKFLIGLDGVLQIKNTATTPTPVTLYAKYIEPDGNVGKEIFRNLTLQYYTDPDPWVFNSFLEAKFVSWRLGTGSKSKFPVFFNSLQEEPLLAPALIEWIGSTLSNPNNLPITYSSSNTSVATIDSSGNVTPLENGTTVISASFAGNSQYQLSTVSYNYYVWHFNPTPTQTITYFNSSDTDCYFYCGATLCGVLNPCFRLYENSLFLLQTESNKIISYNSDNRTCESVPITNKAQQLILNLVQLYLELYGVNISYVDCSQKTELETASSLTRNLSIATTEFSHQTNSLTIGQTNTDIIILQDGYVYDITCSDSSVLEYSIYDNDTKVLVSGKNQGSASITVTAVTGTHVTYNYTVVQENVQTTMITYPVGVSSNGVMHHQASGYSTEYINRVTQSGSCSMAIKAVGTNIGNLIITKSGSGFNYTPIIENWGVLVVSYSGWRGGSISVSQQTTLTIESSNDTNNEYRYLYLFEAVLDENNQRLIQGEFTTKTIRVPASGLSGTTYLNKYPYLFFDDLYNTPTQAVVIESSNDVLSAKPIENYISETSGEFINLLNITEQTAILTKVDFLINSNSGSTYRDALIKLDKTTDNISTDVWNDSVSLHFIQEYRSNNRIYYGPKQYTTNIVRYIDPQNTSDSLNKDHVFQIAYSKILNETFTIDSSSFGSHDCTVCYPSDITSRYNISVQNASSDTSIQYRWGDLNYVIRQLSGSSYPVITFTKLN